MHQQIGWLRQRLDAPLPGIHAQERMTGRVIAMPRAVPAHARVGAVLCLMYPHQDSLHVLLMKRREDRSAHSGQVSFPGGRHEQEDGSYMATALREAHEEVGVLPADVDVLGGLTSLYIPVSNFNVFPYVGFMSQRPDLRLSEAEVSYTIETPFHQLLDDGRKIITDVHSPAVSGKIKNVKAYRLDDGTIIWGATAMIISELETIVKEYSGIWR